MVEFERGRRSLWVSRECEREFHTVASANLHLSTIIVKVKGEMKNKVVSNNHGMRIMKRID
ncbi:hypothetical protein M5K25_003704 [Dendrobium thyrsiflorum]|uniref:Uncharacterized protein n=1 Tax=Dendrobium thyrsiflorum TaxID=117978 RepID=A0ABD0VJW9_DENTH